MYLEFEIALYHVRDETHLCFIYGSIEIWSLLSVACGLEKMCNECYVWHTCVVFIFHKVYAW